MWGVGSFLEGLESSVLNNAVADEVIRCHHFVGLCDAARPGDEGLVMSANVGRGGVCSASCQAPNQTVLFGHMPQFYCKYREPGRNNSSVLRNNRITLLHDT